MGARFNPYLCRAWVEVCKPGGDMVPVNEVGTQYGEWPFKAAIRV